MRRLEIRRCTVSWATSTVYSRSCTAGARYILNLVNACFSQGAPRRLVPPKHTVTLPVRALSFRIAFRSILVLFLLFPGAHDGFDASCSVEAPPAGT